jgi:hypothetical protein
MPDIDPNWFSAIATIFAAVATAAAAITTHLAYKFHRSIEKNRQYLLKGEVLLKNIQSLIVTFANVHATAKEDCSVERTEKLRLLSKEIKYTATIIASLSPTVGAKIESWRISKDRKGDSIPRIVDYILCGTGAIIGDNHDDFLFKKSTELRTIQDELFKEISS